MKEQQQKSQLTAEQVIIKVGSWLPPIQKPTQNFWLCRNFTMIGLLLSLNSNSRQSSPPCCMLCVWQMGARSTTSFRAISNSEVRKLLRKAENISIPRHLKQILTRPEFRDQEELQHDRIWRLRSYDWKLYLCISLDHKWHTVLSVHVFIILTLYKWILYILH